MYKKFLLYLLVIPSYQICCFRQYPTWAKILSDEVLMSEGFDFAQIGYELVAQFDNNTV